jgi:hypothetical protein
MNKLYKKLNRESDHIRLTAAEKNAIKARLFGLSAGKAGAPSPVRVVRSPYVFFASHRFLAALAALVLVVFAGGSTAFAAQGALPGQPLYALKTKVLEPVAVALAPTPAAKAAVHVELAQRRVNEAETLAQQGTLTASTSAELAANFESNAQSAETIAAQIATSDPAGSVQIHTQIDASSAVGGAVLAALGNEGDHSQEGDQTRALAVRVLAAGRTGHQEGNNDGHAGTAVARIEPPVHAFAVTTGTAASSAEATVTPAGSQSQSETAGVTPEKENTAAQLEQKAQDALGAARAGFASASSTLDASTTVAVQTSLAGIDALIGSGATALGDSLFDSAVRDFTDAYSRALQLKALLKAQQTFDTPSIAPLLRLEIHGRNNGDN